MGFDFVPGGVFTPITATRDFEIRKEELLALDSVQSVRVSENTNNIPALPEGKGWGKGGGHVANYAPHPP